jgi:hypothetical protein
MVASGDAKSCVKSGQYGTKHVKVAIVGDFNLQTDGEMLADLCYLASCLACLK